MKEFRTKEELLEEITRHTGVSSPVNLSFVPADNMNLRSRWSIHYVVKRTANGLKQWRWSSAETLGEAIRAAAKECGIDGT